MTTPTREGPSPVQKTVPKDLSRCYNHPERMAVSVCAVCKRGICRLCRVTSKGKNFCTADSDLLRRTDQRTDRVKFKRRVISGAAVLATLNGTAAAVVGFLLLIIGLVGPQAETSYQFTPALQGFFNYFADVLTFPSSQALSIGLFSFVAGLVDIMLAIFLVRRSRLAGILSIGVSVLGGFLVSSYLIILALAGVFTYIHVVTSFVKVALIGLGWGYLDEK